MPSLKPDASATAVTLASLARSAALCAQTDAMLAEGDAALLRLHAGDDHRTLRVPALLVLPAARRARVLRHWIRALGLPPLPALVVEQIERDLLGARADAEARFAWSGARVLRWRDFLHETRLDWSAQLLSVPKLGIERASKIAGYRSSIALHHALSTRGGKTPGAIARELAERWR